MPDPDVTIAAFLKEGEDAMAGGGICRPHSEFFPDVAFVTSGVALLAPTFPDKALACLMPPAQSGGHYAQPYLGECLACDADGA